MNNTSEWVTRIAQEVVKQLEQTKSTPSCDELGIFETVDEAIQAAHRAYRQLHTHSVEERGRFISAIRACAVEESEQISYMAVKESQMGRASDKILKNMAAALNSPGIEDLDKSCWSGDKGLTLVERGAYGVIGSITPTTNPTETIICNSIGMISAGNAVFFSPHPTAKETSLYTIRAINAAIIKAGGPTNLLTAVAEPSIDAANQMMSHPLVRMLVATGGPGVVQAVLSSGKKAIGAGAGNPPVIVDQTADIPKAARDIVAGASFDNNLPCVAEKELIVIGSIADELKAHMRKAGAYLASPQELQKLEKLLLVQGENGHLGASKNYIGRDALVILKAIGVEAPAGTRLILCETDEAHPFVQEELMMPVLPMVQVRDVDSAIEMAVRVEHGNRHTAVMHSKNVDHMTAFARAIDTTIFVKNGPSYAGIGVGGEGFSTFTIAGPTGEGLTSTRSFTRQRRCVLVDGFSIV